MDPRPLLGLRNNASPIRVHRAHRIMRVYVLVAPVLHINDKKLTSVAPASDEAGEKIRDKCP